MEEWTVSTVCEMGALQGCRRSPTESERTLRLSWPDNAEAALSGHAVVDFAMIERVLASDGPVARAMGPEFEIRREQVEMARVVLETMGSRSRLLVEAGTGVGKSFAYLVPAIIRCLGHGEVVVVATHTIALQEQLVKRDIPLLSATIGQGGGVEGWSGELRPALVKGRGNYLSIRRLELASKRQERLFGEAAALASLHLIEDWAYTTTDGTLATLPRLERPSVWEYAQSDSENCMGRNCPHYMRCFYQRSRREAESANLLICNHAIFFADLALRAVGAKMLPDYQHVILDEAHTIEDVASEHFGLSLTQGRVEFLLRQLFDARRRTGHLEHVRVLGVDVQAVDAAINATLAAVNASQAFFDGWAALVESGEVGTGRVRFAGMVENELSAALTDLSLRLKTVRESVKDEQEKFDLTMYAKRAADMAAAATAFVDQTLPGSVYWVEIQGDRSRPRIDLRSAPIEVGPMLRKHLFAEGRSVTLTSATLATTVGSRGGSRDPFEHVRRRLGCDDARTLLLGSPFSYSTQVTLHIDRTMPSPNAMRAASDGRGESHRQRETTHEVGGRPAQRYNAALADRIVHHVAATRGGAFVLFTSFATLEAVARLIESELAVMGLPMLVQGRDGVRGGLLERFRENEDSVLLGAATFWQGVDVRGHGLRNVIITRLPFDPPDRPLTEARLEQIAWRGGDGFKEDSLPRAIIRFKQGFGRLIRSRSDTGRIVVLDPRIATSWYGRLFLDALPGGIRVIVDGIGG